MNKWKAPVRWTVWRFGPWLVKERPAGDWVVDQLDREKARVRRYGPYKTYSEAKAKWLDLTTPNTKAQGRRATGPRND